MAWYSYDGGRIVLQTTPPLKTCDLNRMPDDLPIFLLTLGGATFEKTPVSIIGNVLRRETVNCDTSNCVFEHRSYTVAFSCAPRFKWRHAV